MAETDTKVIIIGAGSAGLLLAQGLKDADIPFQIFERHAKDHKSREWSMSMHWGSEFLTSVLSPELKGRLHEIDTDPHYDFSKDSGFVQCNGETAEVLIVMPGTMPRRVSRTKLRGLLSSDIDVQYDKKLDSVAIDETSGVVTAQFADGTTVTGKALVGCDGSRSKVRSIMIGDEKLAEAWDAGCTILNFPSSYPADIARSLRDVHPIMKVSYHPKLNMMYLLTILDGSSSDPAEWTYQHVISWAGSPTPAELVTPEAKLAQLKSLGVPFAHPWRTAALEVADDVDLYVDRGTSWDPRAVFKLQTSDDDTQTLAPTGSTWNGNSWHGLVTLAGDAAHTMLPHRGQGLNNALEDANRLIKALTSAVKDGTSNLQSSIAAYEAEMVQRGGGEVEISMKASKAAHNWDMLMQSPIFKHGANKVK